MIIHHPPHKRKKAIEKDQHIKELKDLAVNNLYQTM